MPNYPCKYRSEFAKLVTDETRSGQSLRDRFLKGEVAHRGKGTVYEDDMEHKVVAKFNKMGISNKTLTELSESANAKNESHNTLGTKLFHSLSPRIQSVLSRSCALVTNDYDTSESTCSFASQEVVAAFESYLVSLALAGSKKEIDFSAGYPAQQSQNVYDLFDTIFSSPPKIVMRNKGRHKVSNNTKHLHAVMVPTVHFYFASDEKAGSGSGNDNGQVKSSAFYRILLYAVCHFHGLETASTVMAPKGKQRSGKGKNMQGGIKVVTVQGGLLLCPSLKILDYVEQ